jgi:hypothetical protein
VEGDPPHELGDLEFYEDDTCPVVVQPGSLFKKGPSSRRRTEINYGVQIVLGEGNSGFPLFNPASQGGHGKREAMEYFPGASIEEPMNRLDWLPFFVKPAEINNNY